MLLLLTACSNAVPEDIEITESGWHTISAEEAYIIMEESDNYILLDVRTEEEFVEKRIDGAILIPDFEIAVRAETELPDKEATILIYCRSGRRSASAAETLTALGYTNVYDFGGIIDWPYETVSGFLVISKAELGPELVDAYSYHYSPEVLAENLSKLASTYDGQITLGVYGLSVQGRNLNYAQIGNGSKDIIFTGGIHAREYLSSVAVMNILEEFLRLQITGDPAITSLLEEYRIWFLPSLNPDGAEISQSEENTALKANARMVDLNRNFAEGWEDFAGNKEESNELYKGPSPLSEPETKSLVEFFESPDLDIAYSIEMHTLGDVIYCDETRGEETLRLAEIMSAATGFPIWEDPSEGANFSDYLGARGIPTITIELGTFTGNIVDESEGPAIKEIVKKIPRALCELI